MLRWAPLAFTELLARRSTPLIQMGAELDNPLAYRETDRHIYRTFLKRPLSGSFDELGNNATVAWCPLLASTAGQLRVAPFDESQIGIPTAIEVYPALLKQKKRIGDRSAAACLPPVRALLPIGVGLPTMQPPTGAIADIKREGWIFYSASDWRSARP